MHTKRLFMLPFKNNIDVKSGNNKLTCLKDKMFNLGYFGCLTIFVVKIIESTVKNITG